MFTRIAGALWAVVLVAVLAGCGASESEPEESGTAGGGATAESPSDSPSPSSSGSAAGEATGEDYRAILAALLAQGQLVATATTAEEFNQKADLPEGVEMAQLDKKTMTLCLEDSTKDIAFVFASEELVLQSGTCAEGDEVASLQPKGKKGLTISGDRSLAQPVSDYFKRAFGS